MSRKGNKGEPIDRLDKSRIRLTDETGYFKHKFSVIKKYECRIHGIPDSIQHTSQFKV